MTEKISEFRRRMDDGSTLVLVPHKAESAVKDSEGQTITLTYATKAELQLVKDVADNAVRKDTSASQTMTGSLIVGGHDLSKAVTTDEVQEITGMKTLYRGTETDLLFLRSSISYTSTADRSRSVVFTDVDGQAVGRVGNLIGGSSGRFGTRIIAYDPSTSNNSIFGIFINRDTNETYAECPTPTRYRAKSVATLEYLKYTGQNAINVGQNLVHTDGNETIDGTKTFKQKTNIAVNLATMSFSSGADANQWRKIGEITKKLADQYTSLSMTFMLETGFYNSNKGGVGLFYFVRPYSGQSTGLWLIGKSELADIMDGFHIAFAERSDGVIEVLAKGRAYTSFWIHCISVGNGSTRYNQTDIIKAQVATNIATPSPDNYTRFTEIVGASQ